MYSLDQLSYSIASGIPVTLTCVKCWNISHHSHIRYYIYEIYHFDHELHENVYVYGSDDWYFSIWHVSMSLKFHWQLSKWLRPLNYPKVHAFLDGPKKIFIYKDVIVSHRLHFFLFCYVSRLLLFFLITVNLLMRLTL